MISCIEYRACGGLFDNYLKEFMWCQSKNLNKVNLNSSIMFLVIVNSVWCLCGLIIGRFLKSPV